MALPSSGQVSLSTISSELLRTANTSISLGEANVRTLLQTPTGAISMSNAYSKKKRVQIAAAIRYIATPADNPTDTYIMYNTNGRFTPELDMDVQILIVGGGGGGDYRYASGGGGGGGGGVYYNSSLRLTGGVEYRITSGGNGGWGNGTTLAGASGASAAFYGGVHNISVSGGLPSGYSSGYNYGRGGSPNGVNGGLIPGGAGTQGTTNSITGVPYVYGSGGGAGGTTGGAGGTGAGRGGNTNEYGTTAFNYGAGGGGGGYYTGGTYYYGGNGATAVVIIRSNMSLYL